MTARGLVTTSLCVSAGVHAALAAMHAGGSSTAQFALFEAVAVAALATIVLLRSGARSGPIAAIALLLLTSVAYALSRMVELPVVGREPMDVLGVVTVCIQVVGAAIAVTLVRSPARADRAPLAICALIVVYSLLASYAVPSVHRSHQAGHDHASTT
ncbi:MAG: hypothetical protein JWO69_270 [Thermoleophilia bacterium]|jgi:hypothetical protein|nr:hypothetical protein [Thermoleophilia bacterium]